jgi:Na+/H+-dicarboxylate symporter
MLKLQLHWQILIALLLAVIVGSLTGKDASLLGITFYSIYDFIGTLFLNALKMIIVPLIAASIIMGMANMGSSSDFGRLGGKTLLYYMATSLLAILTGLILVDLIQPGILNGVPAKEAIGLSADTSQYVEKISGRGTGDIVDIFVRMIPTNIVKTASDNGDMLALIFLVMIQGS